MTQSIEQFTFTHNGADYVARVYPDTDHGHPWDECDGHGSVELIDDRDPVPRGWTVIHDANRGRWIYNTGAAIVQARRERWGCEVGRLLGLKRGAMAYAAVKADREYLASYLREEWCYVGVSVQPVGADGDDFRAAVWGIESTAGDYLREVAQDLVGEL